MERLKQLLWATASGLAFVVGTAGPAAADPASMIISAVGLAGATSAAGIVAASLIRIGVGLAMSYLGQMIAQANAPKQTSPGIRTKTSTEGGALPQTRIIGRYATAGNIMMPRYAWGDDVDDVENAFRFALFDLADYPITSLDAVFVNGKKWHDGNLTGAWTDFDGKLPDKAVGNTAQYWETVDGTDVFDLAIRFRDGTQGSGSADPGMVAKFGSHPKRPFTSAMYGRFIPYARMRFRYNPEIWQGEPQCLFEVKGEKLYNLRNDTTAGGSGTDRLTNESTWSYQDNPFVAIYNLMYGLPLPEGGRWGVGVDPANMPYAAWSQAMATCAATVGYGQRYRFGYEIRMANPEAGGETPLDVIDELLKSCSGQIADCGGVWLARSGPPGANVFDITDDDCLVDEPQEFSIHEGITQVFNSARGTHPHPERMWEDSEAPFYQDAAAVAQDGAELVADLTFPAVWHRPQVKKLMRDYIKDSRRFRRHTLVLPPQYSNIMPLDAIGWTSVRNGYTAKKFEVFEVAHDPLTLCVTLSIRERDPADYTDTDTDDANPNGEIVEPTYPALPGFDALAVTIEDKDGNPKDNAILLQWSKKVASRRIQYQGRRVGTTNVRWRGVIENDGDGEATVHDVPRKAAMEFRARGKSPKTGWTAWNPATVGDRRIRRKDLEIGAVGGRQLKPHAKKNLIPLWDIDDDILPSSDEDSTFDTNNGSYAIQGSANTGRSSIRFTRTAGLSGWVGTWPTDRAPVSGGTKYYIETMLRTSGADGSGGKVQARANFYRANGDFIETRVLRPFGSHPAYDGTYRKFSDRIVPHSDARLVGLDVYVDSTGPSWVDIDRVLIDEAQVGDKTHDGDIGKRQGKKGDFSAIARFEKNDRWNTAARGTAREVIGGSVACDGETALDVMLQFMGDSLGEKIGGKMDFSAAIDLRFYAGSDKFYEETIYWESDENRPKKIVVLATDSKIRSGTVKYRVDAFRRNNADSGCEADFRHIKFKVGKHAR